MTNRACFGRSGCMINEWRTLCYQYRYQTDTSWNTINTFWIETLCYCRNCWRILILDLYHVAEAGNRAVFSFANLIGAIEAFRAPTWPFEYLESVDSSLKEEKEGGLWKVSFGSVDQPLGSIGAWLHIGPIQSEERSNDGMEPQQSQSANREKRMKTRWSINDKELISGLLDWKTSGL